MHFGRIKKAVAYILAASTVICISGCGQKAAPPAETTALDEAKSERYAAIENKLNEVDQVLDQYYLNDDELDMQSMEDGIMKGYVEGVGEKYTTYYTAEEYRSLLESTSGVYGGIGMIVSQNVNTMLVTVLSVFEGSPAEAAGMVAGDIIAEVNGEDVTGQEVNLIVSKIKGEAGTTVDLKLYRSSVDDYIEMTVERQNIEVPTVSHKMLEDEIGYIYISSFDLITVTQFSEAVDDLTAQGMKGLIVDLRDNPGGSVVSVCQILDRILPTDQLLVYTIDKNDQKEEMRSIDDDQIDVPMVVLVNDQSASASEIFTGAMKDYKRATIVGNKTFGKGIVQAIVPLKDGSAVKVTTSRYYTPGGVCIHGEGIEPDVEVDLDRETEDDEQLQAAIDLLKK